MARQSRELAAFQILERVFLSMPTQAQTDAENNAIVFNLLSGMPAAAAAAADADLHRFVERCGRMPGLERSDAHADDLPDYVLAMISANVSGRVADAVAREVDLSLRQQRSRKKDPHDVDFAKTLYQVMLRGPHERIFRHLMPRLENDEDVRIAKFFYRHVETVRTICESQNDQNALLDYLMPHVQEVIKETAGDLNPTLRGLHDVLSQYESLAKNDSSLWTTIGKGEAGGGLKQLFARFDELAQLTHARNLAVTDSDRSVHIVHRKPLEPVYRDRLMRVQKAVGQYLKLSIHEFDARRDALTAAHDAAVDIVSALEREPALRPPQRILLTALVRRICDIFRRTIGWYCDEPQRRIEANETEDKITFWCVFTSDPAKWAIPAKSKSKQIEKLTWSDVYKDSGRLLNVMADQIERLRSARGMEPPPIAGQHDLFEETYVEWVSNDLDVDAIKSTVVKRSWWLHIVYKCLTNLVFASVLLIVVPCVWAIAMDRFGVHWLEGGGFFLVAVALSITAVIAFSVILRKFFLLCRRALDWTLKHWFKKEPCDRKRHFWFQATLPRIARLIAAPMVLIAEFDHSYKFPLNGSSPILLLLMILSFFTTRFFVSRELFPHNHTAELTRVHRRRVRQNVAVALSHAFAVALLFSMFFVTTHLRAEREKRETTPKTAASEQSTPKCDEYGRFFGVLPREISFDVGEVSSHLGLPPPRFVVVYGNFMFYPTIILTWTAMGLFFGAFLEGFLSGKRLRGDRENESPAE